MAVEGQQALGAVTTLTYNPQRLDLSYMRGDLTHIRGSGAEFFVDTGNSDLRCGPMSSASAVDKEIPVGVFISCVQLARKYQTARKYQGIYFMSGNDEGQISDTAHWVYRDHRDVHWTTGQTHSDVYIRIHAYTRNVYTGVYTYIQAHFKAQLRRAAFMGFPCF